jgi:transposase
MPAKKYRVKLTEGERDYLLQLTSRGKVAARKLNHAKVLLHADEASEKAGMLKDAGIARAVHISLKSIERIRKRFVEEGLESALNPKVQKRRRPKKLDGEAEAFLIATACSTAPEGYSDWTLQLLAERLVECEIVDSISGECVRQTLKKTSLSLG